jgi:hypothetical protein
MSRRASFLIVSLLVLVHAGLLTWSAVHQSVNFDEAAHLAAGVAYWHDGEMGIYSHSPPLLRYWGALPAVMVGVNVPNPAAYADQSAFTRHWDFSRAFAQLNRDRYARLVVLGRLGMIPLSCVGLLIVYVWGRKLWGDVAAIGPAAIWAVEPNVLAQGSIVGTDGGVAVLCLLAGWRWWRMLDRPTWPRSFAAAFALAAATISKFNALLLWPALIVIRFAAAFRGGRTYARSIGASVAIAILVTLLVIAGAYQFRAFGVTLGTFQGYSFLMQRLEKSLPKKLWLPVPRDFLLGFDAQKAESDAGGESYLLGEQYFHSTRWLYYPAALVCKVPPELLLLIAIATGLGIWWCVKNRAWPALKHIAWLLPAVTMLCLAGNSYLNVGIRYLLPALPFMLVGLGGLFAQKRWRWMAIVLVAMMTGETIWQAPRFMTYASPLLGGPRHAWKIVAADFDWGQGVAELARWQAQTESGRIGAAVLCSVDPSIYGLDYVPADHLSDERFVAVSTHYLSGLAFRMPLDGGGMMDHRLKVLQWRQLWASKPIFIADDCIYIFTRAEFDAAASSNY